MNTPLEDWGLPDPDDIGQSEYRAIWECVSDGLASLDEGDDPAACALGMLTEFEEWAQSMKKTIRSGREKRSGRAKKGKR